MSLALASSVIIDGATECPTAARVTEQLATMAPNQRDSATPDRAHLHAHGDTIEVELVSGSGRSLARRPFARDASCDELALAIAVVIATWEADLVGAAPALSVAARAASPPSPPSPALGVVIGAGVLGSIDRTSTVPGGQADVELTRAGARWAVDLGVIAQTRRSVALQPGRVSWARDVLAAGVRYRIGALGAVSAELGGDAGIALRMVSGSGFAVDRSGLGVDPEVSAGVRLCWNHAAWGVFAGVTALGWLAQDRLDVTGIANVIDLPQGELQVGLGILWRSLPP